MSNKKDDIKGQIRRPASPHASIIEPIGPKRPVLPFEKQPRFEDLNSRHAVWIDNDLGATIDSLVLDERGKMMKGVKTKIINDALRDYFEKHGIPIVDAKTKS